MLPALKAREARYKAANVKKLTINFLPPDHDLYEFLDGKESKSGYVKQLIRADMKNSKGEE